MTRQPDGVNRRRFFTLGGALAAAGSLPVGTIAAPPRAGDDRTFVTATEGTNIAASVSPDGRQVAIDLYAMLWILPIEGGGARRLTEDLQEIAQPSWTPDGAGLVFQSYADGNFHIWSIRPDGSGLRRLTSGPHDDREPRVSPDGRTIAFSSDRGGAYGIHLLDLDAGAIRQVSTGPGDAFEPAWSPDGARLAVTIDKTRIDIIQLKDGARRTVVKVAPGGAVSGASFTPDGSDVLFTAIESGRAELRSASGRIVVAGEDVFPFPVSWLGANEFVHTADGAIKRRTLGGGEARVIPFHAAAPVVTPNYEKKRRDFDFDGPRPVVGMGSPALSPDGGRVVFRALNDLYLLPVGDRARPVVIGPHHKLDPAWSPDGRRLVFSSDRGGALALWLKDLASGEERQLTQTDDAALSPAWSRDGRRIAFLNQNGGLHLVDVATGEVRRLYDDLWEPGKPSWSPDGRTIALAAFKPYSARFREGLSEILTVDVETGKGNYQPILPHRSLSTRGDDGPVWSPDGTRLAFIFASRLWTAPVDQAGRLTGEPTALNDEVSDAPTWNGDSSQILYLCAGQLRLISSFGGVPRTVPHGLTWSAARSATRTVIAAGRLWDGLSPHLQRDMEIVLAGPRIEAVRPLGSAEVVADARHIDARDRLVMPGLVDMHTHRQMQGYAYGGREGRLWLSLGITTTRSPGGPAYHTVEDQESIQSGARLGPRYFATGEAIDGSRIYYNFMRPVTEPGQMALELQRAEALSYDLIKTYVRLSAERQKAVTAWAHAHGLPVTSHYHYPALGLGVDGMEHMGATSRTGYSRTVSALGAVYQDVNAVFVQSGAPRTPTLFLAQAMLGEDRSLVEDSRVRALYPPWEYARLRARADLWSRQDRRPSLEALGRQVAEIARTIRSGGRIVAGTDSPIDSNAVSLHMNLRAMVRFGLTPYEALVTATRASGEFLGEPLGVVKAGAWADLIVVDGEPLSRIEDLARVTLTIANGQPHSMAELIGPFQATATAALTRRFLCETEPQYWWHDPDWLEAARSSCCDGACAPRMNV